MRLHRLEIEGFGPFRARQRVDFDAFADDGIFLIAGRTGAGKSSILDAVCFGLYGGVPRYDGGEKRLRSDHCEPDDISEVVVEFSTVAGRFRVTRSPEYLRPAKRGGGMTKQAAAVALDELTDAGWVGRAARAVDVGNELAEILQLSREQFLQVILLAQNRFSEFLLANSKDRQALLRRLFGTERFDDVQSRFEDRRRAAEHALGLRLATVSARMDEAERLVSTAGLWGDGGGADESVAGAAESGGAEAPDRAAAGVSGGAGSSAAASAGGAGVRAGAGATDLGGVRGAEGRIEALRRALARAGYQRGRRAAERDEAEIALTAADAASAALREDRRAQAERDRVRAELDRLEAEAPQIDAARAELEAARAAEALRSTLAAVVRARGARDVALAQEGDALAAWTLHEVELVGADDETTPADLVSLLEGWAEERTKESGGWERARELERREPELAVELEASEERVSLATARVEAIDTERAGLPTIIAELTASRDAARRLADRVDDLLVAREAAAARRDATGDVERLTAQEAADDRAVAEAATAFAAAQTLFAQLRTRRSEGMSGELAAALVDGESCPVCGSVEHPAPAEHADPVSADDVADAEAARDAAAQRERAAAEALAVTSAALDAARRRAEGRSAGQAAAELDDATARHADAETAVAEADRLDAELQRLITRTAQIEKERHDAARDLAAAREDHAALSQRSADATAQITAARGDFATVSERLEVLRGRIASARALADAISARLRQEGLVAAAEEEQGAALAASDFDDPAAVELALRSDSARDALAARIDEHTAQLGKERAILLDLELRALPEEPIDVAPAERAAADARATWTAAVDAASRTDATVAQLTGLLDSAASEHARTADASAEFETLRDLADTIAGRGPNTRKMPLETFVLAAELEEIVQAANRRLHDMSTGRYRLQHSDALAARGAASGLGIVVFDAFTGVTRPPQSLSGGETFLSSLALALGLAEVVTARAGGIRLDTLFIDEGFGSLDGDTLDVAMRTLDELRQGGRTVGVISHVEAMQEQIPAQLTVRATAEGPSIIETR